MLPKGEGTPWRRSPFPTAGTSNMPPRLALAFSGELSRSEALADDLEKRFPEDTFARFTYVPVLRALSSLDRGKPADSIEQLQIALQYELAVNGLNRTFLSGWSALGLCARRGFCGRAPLCGSSGRVSENPRSPRYRGRGSNWRYWRTCNWAERSRCQGDTAKAKTAYQDFLTLWEGRRPRRPDPQASQGRLPRAPMS